MARRPAGTICSAVALVDFTHSVLHQTDEFRESQRALMVANLNSAGWLPFLGVPLSLPSSDSSLGNNNVISTGTPNHRVGVWPGH
jgi:hypothetical protein